MRSGLFILWLIVWSCSAFGLKRMVMLITLRFIANEPGRLRLAAASSRMVWLVCAVLLVSGCDAPGPDTTVRPFTIAGTTFPDTEGERHWLAFRDRLAEASNGELPLRMLIYGQLGSEDQLVSGLRRGRVQ